MSRSPDTSLTTQFRGSTAPTPGFRRATPEPATSRPAHNDRQPVPSSTEVESLGRGGSHHGTQGCFHSIAYTPDKVSPPNRSSQQNATSGTAANSVTNLSRQPLGPANVRGTLNLRPTRTNVAPRNMARSTLVEKIDRTACPARPSKRTGIPQHGTERAYLNWDCRCPDACESYRLYRKRLREGRAQPGMTSALGTARRLQALACLGYSAVNLAEKLNIPRSGVGYLRGQRYPTIVRSRARQVAQMYAELCWTPLAGLDAQRTKTYARKFGWAPPAAWDDNIDDAHAKPQHLLEDYGEESVNEEVELQLLLSGHAKHPEDYATPAARWRWRNLCIQAVDILTERGLPLPEIEDRLHLSERQILRFKKVLRERREPELAGPRGINNTAGTTPSDTTPREAHVA